MTREDQLISGRRLHRAMGEVQTGLTHVEVSNTTGKEEMTKNKFVEDACHDENRRNLSQTSKTSLVYSQLAHEI